MTRASSRILLWGGIAVVAVVAIVVIAVTWQRGSTPSPAPVAAQKIEAPPAAPAPAAPKPVATSPQPAPAPATTPATAPPVQAAPVAPVKTATAPASQTEVPRFDIVRVDPSGHAVLAGRAAPGSEVTVYDDGRVIGRATADGDGNWVLVLDQPLPSGQGQLTLSATSKDGAVTRSDGVVALLVPERATNPTPAAQTQATTSPPAATPMTAETPAAKTETPIAVLVPKEGPATTLQLPPLKGKGEERLSMDLVEYGTKGNVILEGRAAPGARIDAYINNKRVGSATAGQDGKWRIITDQEVAAGRYQLKLESHNEAGKQVAELTMPFERAVLPEQIPGDLVIVQPGNSLWRIARRSYGHGRRYVEIYHANRNQISNPQLIFPGQLLQIPGKS